MFSKLIGKSSSLALRSAQRFSKSHVQVCATTVSRLNFHSSSKLFDHHETTPLESANALLEALEELKKTPKDEEIIQKVTSLESAMENIAISNKMALAAKHDFIQSEVDMVISEVNLVKGDLEKEEKWQKAFGWWEPEFLLPAGIFVAIPALHFEYYVVNDESLLMCVFVAFSTILYKKAGPMLFETLKKDNEEEKKEREEVVKKQIEMFEHNVDHIKLNWNIVEDYKKISELKVQAYEKLNAAGVNRPLFAYKQQMEKMLHVVAAEEQSIKEKKKQAMMEEATSFVTDQFASSVDLKKASLANAIAVLKGKAGATDPVQQTYVKFFKAKAVEGAKIDPKQEILDNRASIVGKLNAIAKNDGYYFNFDADGKPKMAV